MAVETLVKPDNAFSIRPAQARRKGMERLPPESLASIRQKWKTPGWSLPGPAPHRTTPSPRHSLVSRRTSPAAGPALLPRSQVLTSAPAAGLNPATRRYQRSLPASAVSGIPPPSPCSSPSASPTPGAPLQPPAPAKSSTRQRPSRSPGNPATRGQRHHPGQDATGPSRTHASPGVQNAPLKRGRCTAAGPLRGATMHRSNRGDVSAHRNQG